MPPQGASYQQVPRMDNDLRYMPHPGLNLPFQAMQGASYASGVRPLDLNLNVGLDHRFQVGSMPPQNVGDVFHEFSVPAQSMDGISTMPSAGGDVPSITTLRSASGPSTSGSKNRRGPKKPYELQIIDCSGPPQKGRRRKNRNSEASKVSPLLTNLSTTHGPKTVPYFCAVRRGSARVFPVFPPSCDWIVATISHVPAPSIRRKQSNTQSDHQPSGEQHH
jgi:hypothetical protein